MAYVEVWKGGKLITRRQVSEEKARKGCRIRLGSAGQVRVKTGETKTVGKFEIRMFAGDLPRVRQEQTLSTLTGTRASEVREETSYFPEIEGYKITGRLGEGGMGTVWRAVQLSTHREVALKLLSERRFESRKSRLRFEREVELTARLVHPNIARLYDSGLYREIYYYAMELVDGVPLDKYVQQNQLSHTEILELIYQVSQAVGYAHEQGIIHRDLKPSNILVSKDGQPHVLDFGLAKSTTLESEDVTVSIEGEIAGTPAYMAPEQAAGNIHKISTRTDVYSLGVLLYYLLTNQLPYDIEGGKYEVLSRIIQDEIPSPRKIDPSIDRELEAILMTALAKEPNERYPSAMVFQMDIDNYLKDEPILAKMTGTTYYLVKKIKKHRLPVSIGVVVFLLILSIILIAYTKIIQSNTRMRTIREELEIQKQAAEMAKSEADSFKARWDDLEATVLSGRKEKDIRAAMLALKEEYLKTQKLLEGTPEERTAIQAVAENYLNIFGQYNENSFEKLKSIFSDSCISFDSDGRVIKGPQESIAHLMQTVQSAAENFDFDKTVNETATIQVSGNNAFMIGQLILRGQARGKNESAVARQWYMLIFQKIRNKWLIASEYCAPPEIAQGSDVDIAMHKAAYEGNLEEVKALIAEGSDVNAKWPKDINATPLHLAVIKGDEDTLRWFGEQIKDRIKRPDHPGLYTDIVSLLLANGADINAKTSYGWTPLHFAAQLGYSDMAELLITKGADIEAKHTYGRTPLFIASLNNHKDIVNLLIANGAKVDIVIASAIGDTESIKIFLKNDPNMINAERENFTPLHIAAHNGQIETVKFLLEKGADVNAGYPKKPTPLYWAAFGGHLDIAELLINKGAKINNESFGFPHPLFGAMAGKHKEVVELFIAECGGVNAKDSHGFTPLFFATQRGYKDIVELLISKGADVNAKDSRGSTVLFPAVERGHKDIVELLISKGADIEAKNTSGLTPLLTAAINNQKDMENFLIAKGAKVDIVIASAIGDIERIKVFLKNDPNMINAKQSNFTPLRIAAYNGHTETVKFLLEKGADVNANDGRGYTALFTAAEKGYKDIAELLISKGANVNAGNFLPLYAAAKVGNKEMVELLIAKGADINAKTCIGYLDLTALFTAAEKGYKDIVELLIAKGADINAKSRDGRTPLFVAVNVNHIDLVELLISKGADVNAEKFSPLYGAARWGNKEMIELLISKGADINAKDARGSTVLFPAVENGHKDIVELLIRKGANVNTQDGLTPLFVAESKGYKEIAELLRAKGAKAHIPNKMYLGSFGDDAFLFGHWRFRECFWDDPLHLTPSGTPPPGLTFHTFRWTTGDAGIRWPVTPRRKYRLQLACQVEPYIPEPKIFVNGQYIATIKGTDWQVLDSIIPDRIIGNGNVAQVEIKSRTWMPAQKDPHSPDTSNLGIMVAMFSMTESSANTPAE